MIAAEELVGQTAYWEVVEWNYSACRQMPKLVSGTIRSVDELGFCSVCRDGVILLLRPGTWRAYP